MKKFIYVLILLVTSLSFAQDVLNNYKYIVVPTRFDFQKAEDQYQLNSLLKHKFNQLGLNAYLETDDLPKDVKTNSCSYLKPVINAKSNMFATRTVIDLIDCDGNVRYSTREGKSTSKNVRVSYLEAVRASLKSFNGYQYKFEPKEEVVVYTKTVEQKMPGLKAEIVAKNNEAGLNDNTPGGVKIFTHSYNSEKILLAKKGSGFIISGSDDNVLGTMIKSSLKENIYHIALEGKKRICLLYGK